MTNVSDAVSARKSIRAFLDKPVSDEIVRSLLTRAARAPSGGNVQPWHVHVVTGAARTALIDKVKTVAMEHPRGEGTEFAIYPEPTPEPYMARRRKVAADMFELLDIDPKNKMTVAMAMARNLDFFDAPVGLFFSIDRIMAVNQWAHLGMYMQTIALLTIEEGLATCMQEFWAVFHKTVSTYLELPEGRMLYCGMALGYPDEEAVVNRLETERASLEEIVTFLG